MSSNFPGEIGNYRLLEKIGRGTFSIVYLARHKFLAKPGFVAAKLLKEHPFNKKEQDSFLEEISILEKLEHPHILPILDAGIDQGTPYIITKLASGKSLRDLLLKQASQLLPLEDTFRILTQIAEALQTAHKQKPPIVHRDLKPENILLDADGNALLADFGLAKTLSMSVQQVSFGGTLAYMAPEQFEGQVGRRSDQYALGCIAYELMTGKLPSRERLLTPKHFNPLLPEHTSQAILKALAREYDQRHADVIGFIKALSGTKIQRSDETSKHVSLTPYQVLEQTLDPTSIVAYMKRGTAFYKLTRYDEALAAFDQALRLDPQYAIAYNNRGNALYELKRHSEALAAFDQALRLNSQFVNAYNGKGNTLHKLVRYDAALVAFDQALRIDPQFMKAHNGKGYALYELKRYDAALVAFDQALRIDPQFMKAHNGKGYALYELKRYDAALAAFDQALLLDPQFADAHNGKGYALYELKRYDAALAAFDQALLLDPQSTDAYNGKILTSMTSTAIRTL